MKVLCPRCGVNEVDVSSLLLEERPDFLWICSWCATEIAEGKEGDSPMGVFEREVRARIDEEIAENQIKAGKIEFVDEVNCVAVIRVWRRMAKDAYGDSIGELRALMSKNSEGELHCQIIQGSRLGIKVESGAYEER